MTEESSGCVPALPNHTHLTPQEVALFLRIRLRTVYRLCDHDLPHVCWGKVLRIPRTEFLVWYHRHGRHLPTLEKIS